jgi:dTDP-4-dehydrorhamnose 3,5-epimerase
MNVVTTAIPDILIIEPKVFGDERGFFYESFNQKAFNEATGLDISFVQDNHSKSSQNVLRGLHFQLPPHEQGKLVRVTQGCVFDVAVDIRKNSKTFGQHVGLELSAENKRQLWIPPGFAHGFLTISETAEFLYKTTDYYSPAYERCIKWDDCLLKINWSIGISPIVSDKDRQAKSFEQYKLNGFEE